MTHFNIYCGQFYKQFLVIIYEFTVILARNLEYNSRGVKYCGVATDIECFFLIFVKIKLSMSFSSQLNFGPLYSAPEESESKGEFPLGRFCNYLAADLFHSSWEVRHGAATALREILKQHGSSYILLFLKILFLLFSQNINKSTF